MTDKLHWEHLPFYYFIRKYHPDFIFAFAGFESVPNASGEIKNPKRTIPLGLLLGGAILLVFYLLIQLIAVLKDNSKMHLQLPVETWMQGAEHKI